MKKNIIAALIILFAFSCPALGKQGFKPRKIDSASVPSRVKKAFSRDFPGVRIVRWEVHRPKKKKLKKLKVYVCLFLSTDMIKSRARYLSNGRGIASTKYYRFDSLIKLPEQLKDYCKKNYPDYEIQAAEKEKSLKKDRSAFRVRLKKGDEEKTIWISSGGIRIEDKEISQELRMSETEPQSL